MMKIAYFFSKKQFGKVLAPLKIIYARKPKLMNFTLKLISTEDKLSLSPELKLLIKAKVSSLNGCSFCSNLALAQSFKLKLRKEKFQALFSENSFEGISSKEAAVLRYAGEVTENLKVSDECFAELKKHFSENEIVEIVWLVAVENYYNRIAVPLQIGSDELIV